MLLLLVSGRLFSQIREMSQLCSSLGQRKLQERLETVVQALLQLPLGPGSPFNWATTPLLFALRKSLLSVPQSALKAT